MTRITLARMVVVLLASSAVYHADAADDWSLAWRLDNAAAPAGFVRVDLTPAFVDASAPSLSDIRIVPNSFAEAPWDEAKSTQIPYMLHHPPSGGVQVEEWKPLQVINRVYEPNQYEQIVLDYGEPRLKNQLRITLSGENFRRRVTIEGSDEGRFWSKVREDGWLYDISEPHGNYRVDTIDFPVNNFRYVRVTVHHMADDPRRIDIEGVRALHEETHAVEPEPVSIASRMERVDERARTTDVILDLGFRNLPVSLLKLTTEAPYFYRAFEVSGRNENTQRIERKTETGWDQTEREAPWAAVGRGVMYRTLENGVSDEDLTIECRAPYRYLRVRIHDQDNPPLTLGPIEVYRRPLPSIIVENDPSVAVVVLSGNASVGAPSFDLARSVRDLDVETLPVVAFADTPVTRSIEALAPWTARHAWVIWVALVVAVLVVGGLIVTNLAKLKKDAPE